MKNETIQYYNDHASEFCESTYEADMSECRDRFLQYLEPGARILDAGCGSGRDTLAFLENGYQVDAFDASAEICRIASENTGIGVRQLRFEELSGENEYDGVWACASLIHVDKESLLDVLRRIYSLLKTGGVFYASFKQGDGEQVRNGRYFCNATGESLRAMIEAAGFQVKEVFYTHDVREGREDEKWVNVIARE